MDVFKNTGDKYQIIFGLVILLFVGLKITAHLSQYEDLILWDETNYLANGLTFFKDKVDADKGPLYSLWFNTLNRFSETPIHLYYLNFKILTILSALFIFLLLISYQLNAFLSISLSFLFLISEVNVTLPKIGHLNLILWVVILIIYKKLSTKEGKLLFLATGALVSSYIRPEYYLVFLVLLIILIVYIIKKARVINFRKGLLYNMLFAAVLVASLHIILGFPLRSGNKSINNFRHAFAQSYSYWEGEGHGGWQTGINRVSLYNSFFNSAQSIPKAIIANPKWFCKSVAYNSVLTIGQLAYVFLEILIPNSLIPNSLLNSPFIKLPLLIFLLLIGKLFFRRTKYVKDRVKELKNNAFNILIFAIVALVPVFAYMITKPTLFYFPSQLPMFYLCICFFLLPLSHEIDQANNNRLKIAIIYFLMCITLFLVAPTAKNYSFQDNKGTPYLNTVQFLNSLNIKEKVNFLEIEGGLSIYLPSNYSRVGIFGKEENFLAYQKKHNINIIYVSPNLSEPYSFSQDPEWHEFLKNPYEHNFAKLAIPGSENDTSQYLLIRNDLLE